LCPESRRKPFHWLSAVVLMFLTSSAVFAQTADDVTIEVPAADALAMQEAQGGSDENPGVRKGGDDFPSPQAIELAERREKAIRAKVAGKATGKVHEVAKGQFVELALEKNDRVFVVLAEFGNGFSKVGANPTPNVPSTPGPMHNAIPQPDRTKDNSTIWQPDFNKAHFEKMYFTRMNDYYQTQSSGRYSINGDVTEWVRVPFNGPRYGSNVLSDFAVWTLIADAINLWTNNQLASGKSLAEVKAYLQTFDQGDRYDYDRDGNFNEPDGYIDHFQIVHAGIGEETDSVGSPNAIWSHRWFTFYHLRGSYGPSYNKYGGLEFGGGWGANPSGSTEGATSSRLSFAPGATAANVSWAHAANPTGIWVGDYTIQPENGGLGVFAHEYGHDLGLPDHYDTTNAATNSVANWSIMASGSYLGEGLSDIGDRPGDFMSWDKLQLGWLNYEEATAGNFSTHRLGPAETNTKQAQAVLVNLPADKNIFYMINPATGHAYGSKMWWGGKADNADVSMTRSITVPAVIPANGNTPAVNPTMTMRMWFDIESGWDYAYVSVSADGGATWTNLAASGTTTTADPNKQNLGNGITGTTTNVWRLVTFSMTPYANKTVLVRVRYKTDAFVARKGFAFDDLTVGGVLVDGAEAGDNGWTLAGFRVSNGVEVANEPHYYLAEFRQYRTYDEGLRTGPYTFGTAGTPNWVSHYAYQDGLLITYWDLAESNNNVSAHRGEGRVLPVDAHPEPLLRDVAYPGQAPFTSPWSSSIQSYDSTFSLEPTDALSLPFYGTPAAGQPPVQFQANHPSLPPVSVFNDLNPYWYARTSTAGVIVPQTGTTIRIVSTSAHDGFMQIQVK
jgi:immune inhibitor A